MQDRAAEAMAAYLRVRSEPGVDAAKVGFLGYSQAGWVLPIVASRAQPAFTVIIGGAVNWRDQGAYYTRKRLQARAWRPTRSNAAWRPNGPATMRCSANHVRWRMCWRRGPT